MIELEAELYSIKWAGGNPQSDWIHGGKAAPVQFGKIMDMEYNIYNKTTSKHCICSLGDNTVIEEMLLDEYKRDFLESLSRQGEE